MILQRLSSVLNDDGSTPTDEEKPLSACQGDCDSDSDCADGLTCFQRDGYTVVPGCDNLFAFDYDRLFFHDSAPEIGCRRYYLERT